jgi:archaellum component FlaF (FlaF/FlaG flagellin family)
MRKRISIFALITLVSLSYSYAGKVTSMRARQIAKNFYYERVQQYKSVDYQNITTTSIVSEPFQNTTIYYGVNITNGGFVLVSAEDAVLPVLGYSFEGQYSSNDRPENFSAWMEQYSKAIQWCIKNKSKASSQVSSEWERLGSSNSKLLKPFTDQKNVLPMIISNWDQGKYYNTQCPADPQGPDGHCVTGCVATAMAQIMYYYRWPEHGTGSYTYQHPDYGTLSADFGAATYDWDNMQNQLQTYNEGVAELMYHLGVSVDMNYGPTGSGMWNHHAALALGTYFKYLPSTQYVWRDTTNLDWDSLIITHLDRGQVLYYAGWSDTIYVSGHAFVCDGYQDTGYCHFNWGWSGQYNGYFYLNNLNPGGSNFNLVQELIINIYPDTLQSTYPTFCQGLRSVHYLNGTLEDGSGPIANYDNNQSCSWLIDPQVNPLDSISSITISFQQFDTEAGQDSLVIYDGDNTNAAILGTFSGSNLPANLTSSGNKVLLVFNSNNSNTAKGWLLSYRSNLPDYCGTTTMTDLSGTISDGSGPKNYIEGTLCTWSLQPTNASGVSLSFSEFNTEPVFDFVEVYDMTTSVSLGKFSGNQLPPTITCPSGKMYIIFKTNGSVNSGGWTAQYAATNLGIDAEKLNIELLLYPNPASSQLIFTVESPGIKKLQWQILDNCGQSVLQGENSKALSGKKEVIDISKIAAGYYLLKVVTDKGLAVRKISVI